MQLNSTMELGKFGVFWIFAVCNIAGLHVAGWSYHGVSDGPTHWADTYAICDNSNQSPIHLDTSEATVDKTLGAITFTGYDTAPTTYTLTNTGHSVKVIVSGSTIQISGGQLPATYQLEQFHFHWGSTDSLGSEHLLNDVQYPMEMHLVHYNTNYADVATAADQTDGLAVIGVFFEIGATSSTAVQSIVNALSNIPYNADTYDLTPFALDDLVPTSRSAYFRYSGSLTTPACYETVTWTILNTKISITEADMNMFRSGLYEGANAATAAIVDNFRPPQNLNSRTVYMSQKISAGSEIIVSMTTVLIPALVLLLSKQF